MSKASKRPAIVPPTPEEDATIIAAAKADLDAQPLTDAQLAVMAQMHSLSTMAVPNPSIERTKPHGGELQSNVVRTELQRAVEKAERDFAENRWTEHSEVEAKLKLWAR